MSCGCHPSHQRRCNRTLLRNQKCGRKKLSCLGCNTVQPAAPACAGARAPPPRSIYLFRALPAPSATRARSSGRRRARGCPRRRRMSQVLLRALKSAAGAGAPALHECALKPALPPRRARAVSEARRATARRPSTRAQQARPAGTGEGEAAGGAEARYHKNNFCFGQRAVSFRRHA